MAIVTLGALSFFSFLLAQSYPWLCLLLNYLAMRFPYKLLSRDNLVRSSNSISSKLHLNCPCKFVNPNVLINQILIIGRQNHFDGFNTWTNSIQFCCLCIYIYLWFFRNFFVKVNYFYWLPTLLKKTPYLLHYLYVVKNP